MSMEDRSLHGRAGLPAILFSLAMLPSACADEPEALLLRSISGVNHAGHTIRIDLGAPAGTPCSFVDQADSDEADANACMLAPLVTVDGLEFAFNNALRSGSVQRRREDPTNPDVLEVFDWKTRAIGLVGPIARWNGDYHVDLDGRGIVTRMVSLSCIDNLTDQGATYSHDSYVDPDLDPCNGLDPSGNPMKMRLGQEIKAVTPLLTADAHSCTSEGCCDSCGWQTSTRVVPYGVDADGNARTSPDGGDFGATSGSAIACAARDEGGPVDTYAVCRAFAPSVDRQNEELRWDYEWCEDAIGPDCTLVPGGHPVPLADRLREVHPDLRPRGLENLISPCSTTSDCSAMHGLSGSECMGTHRDTGGTCLADAYTDGTCENAVCRPEWVVACRTSAAGLDTDISYCVDRRFDWSVGDACFDGDAGVRDHYERREDLPGVSQGCTCPEGVRNVEELSDEHPCAATQAEACFDGSGEVIAERVGQHAVKFVRRPGGIAYDEPTRSVRWYPADTGGFPRARLESCAEAADGIGGLNRHDGWRAHDGELAENLENFDRAMCSGQEYTIVFNEPGTPDNPAFIADVHGQTLEGASTYVFETAQFRLRPDSGETLSLETGIELRFSNKYDVSPHNLSKLRVSRLECTGDGATRICEVVAPANGCAASAPVAGGLDCAASAQALEDARAMDPCAAPCLTVAVGGQSAGSLEVSIDSAEFGAVLEPGETYRIDVPAAPSVEAAQADDALYRETFWDACGMPLVTDDAAAHGYEFTVQQP